MRQHRNYFNVLVLVLMVFVVLMFPVNNSFAAEPKRGGTLKMVSFMGMPACMGWPANVRTVGSHMYQAPVVEPLFTLG
jgi:hypothetical protein